MATTCEDIDDIEDLIAPGDLMPSDRYYNKKDVIVRGKHKKVSNGIAEHNNEQNGSVSNQESLGCKTRITTSFISDDSRNANNLRQDLGMFA